MARGDLDDLAAFAAVAEARGFSRAAERLGFRARTELDAGLRETVRWYAGASL